MTQSKSQIQGSKRSVGGLPTTHLPPHILTIRGTICGSNFFLGKKLMNIFDITQKYSYRYFMMIYVNKKGPLGQ